MYKQTQTPYKNKGLSQNFIIYFHLLIAFIIFPLQVNSGPSIKFILAPYVVYLVWSKKALYLPALFVFIAAGSILSIVILLTTAVLTVRNLPLFKTMNLTWIILLLLLPSPIFIWQTLERILTMNLGIVDIFTPLSFYLGYFPFFYGILIAPKVNSKIITAIYLTLFLLPFVQIFNTLHVLVEGDLFLPEH